MSKSDITRRDFLKFIGTTSTALMLGSHYFESKVSSLTYPNTSSLTPPNILVIIFDAWSASNTSLYGYPRQTTPVLEKLAQRALVYHHHYSGGNFTSPGTASLLTGLYPWTHLALQMRSQIIDQYSGHSIFNLLPDTYHRFAYTQNLFTFVQLHQFRHAIDDLFKASHTALQSGLIAEKLLFENYYPASEAEQLLLRSEYTPSVSLFLSLLDHIGLRLRYNLLKKRYQPEYPTGLVKWGTDDAAILVHRLEDAIDWIINQANVAPTPHFGYVHLLPPHAPYNPRVDFAELFSNDGWQAPDKPLFKKSPDANAEEIQSRRLNYDRYIAQVDAEFGRLYQALEENGYLKNTILVLTSDHGEILERGMYGHSTPALYEPLIHVPLLIFMPDQQSRIDIYNTTSAVDLVPTLLQLTGGSLPDSLEGKLLPLEPTPDSDNREVYVVEAKRNPRSEPFTQASFALVQWPYKLSLYTGYEDIKEHFELYNLQNDPEELEDIFSVNLPLAQEMKKTLLDRIPSAARPNIQS